SARRRARGAVRPAAGAAPLGGEAAAHELDDAIPKMRITMPQPAMIHQPTWLADANEPAKFALSPAATAEPIAATPGDWPIWRLVDAIAAATPACVAGIPETAALVIGGLTHPKPRPNTAYAAMVYPIGVCADSPVSIAPDAVTAMPAMTSGHRGPCVP